MILARLLARHLSRIRRRRFVFLRVEFMEPWGGSPRWTVVGTPVAGDEVYLATGHDLGHVLREARLEADRLFDEYGGPREGAA